MASNTNRNHNKQEPGQTGTIVNIHHSKLEPQQTGTIANKNHNKPKPYQTQDPSEAQYCIVSAGIHFTYKIFTVPVHITEVCKNEQYKVNLLKFDRPMERVSPSSTSCSMTAQVSRQWLLRSALQNPSSSRGNIVFYRKQNCVPICLRTCKSKMQRVP